MLFQGVLFITIIDCNKCKNKKIYHLISCFISFLKRRFTNCVQQKTNLGSTFYIHLPFFLEHLDNTFYMATGIIIVYYEIVYIIIVTMYKHHLEFIV